MSAWGKSDSEEEFRGGHYIEKKDIEANQHKILKTRIGASGFSTIKQCLRKYVLKIQKLIFSLYFDDKDF